MNTAVPGTRTGRTASTVATKSSSGTARAVRRSATSRRPGLPGGHQREQAQRDGQRDPATLQNLQRIGAEEREVDHQEHGHDGDGGRLWPLPPFRHHHVQQQHRDDHRQRDGDAIGGSEGRRRSEADDDDDRREHQCPVDLRHVDLPHFARRGVLDVEARRETELNRLARNRERTGDQRLRRDDRRRRRQADKRQQRPRGRQQEERMLDRRLEQQQRALTEIVQDQRGSTSANQATRIGCLPK